MLQLRSLILCEGSITAAGVVAQLHGIGQSSLQSCYIYGTSVGGSHAAIQAFCCHIWPSLERLNLSNNQMDAEAITQLASASWPCLTALNLSCTALSHAAFQQLCFGRWPALTDLNVSGNSLSNDSISLLARPPGPAMQMIDWAAQLTVLDLSDSLRASEGGLTASAVEQLSQTCWPRLTTLRLGQVSTDITAISHVVHGRLARVVSISHQRERLTSPSLLGGI